MYDHTIAALPYEKPQFKWKKIGICGKEKVSNCERMERLMDDNGHIEDDNMFLKMDVEGSEYDFIDDVSSDLLNKFDQIVLEVHFLNNPDYYFRAISLFTKLNITHQIIHLHGNNYASYVVGYAGVLPNVLEVTYLKKASHSFIAYDFSFPTKLDMKNNAGAPEINIGKVR